MNNVMYYFTNFITGANQKITDKYKPQDYIAQS